MNEIVKEAHPSKEENENKTELELAGLVYGLDFFVDMNLKTRKALKEKAYAMKIRIKKDALKLLEDLVLEM